jgi:coatomer protein complex subunit alpha (xenin)
LPATPNMPSLVNYVRRTVDETDSRKILPIIPRELESILSTDLTAGKQALVKNKLEDGVASFKKLLHLLIVNAVASQAELSEVRPLFIPEATPTLTMMQAKKAIHTAAQYITALTIEIERRALLQGANDVSALSDDNKKRALELSAYFTIPELEGPHRSIPLFAAMNFAHKNKQLNTALNFANALLDRTGNTKMKDSAKRVKTIAERNPLCGKSYTNLWWQPLSCLSL